MADKDKKKKENSFSTVKGILRSYLWDIFFVSYRRGYLIAQNEKELISLGVIDKPFNTSLFYYNIRTHIQYTEGVKGTYMPRTTMMTVIMQSLLFDNIKKWLNLKLAPNKKRYPIKILYSIFQDSIQLITSYPLTLLTLNMMCLNLKKSKDNPSKYAYDNILDCASKQHQQTGNMSSFYYGIKAALAGIALKNIFTATCDAILGINLNKDVENAASGTGLWRKLAAMSYKTGAVPTVDEMKYFFKFLEKLMWGATAGQFGSLLFYPLIDRIPRHMILLKSNNQNYSYSECIDSIKNDNNYKYPMLSFWKGCNWTLLGLCCMISIGFLLNKFSDQMSAFSVKALQKNKSNSGDDDKNCPICFQRPKTHALNCGHRFCEQDISKIRKTTNKCAVCRENITSVMRVYD